MNDTHVKDRNSWERERKREGGRGRGEYNNKLKNDNYLTRSINYEKTTSSSKNDKVNA